MIIGLSGYSGSGKDTVGILIQYLQCHSVGSTTIEEVLAKYKYHEWWLEDQSGWEIKKWAGKLKYIASLLTGIPVEKFEDQEFKKTYLGEEWDTWSPNIDRPERMTVRDLLQKLGTDGLRNGLHQNTWVNALLADYNNQKRSDWFGDVRTDVAESKWVITDTRFPNEARAIKDRGGIVIRVDRPGVKPVNPHESETALDNWDFDYKIMNGSDILSLMFTVYNILKREGLTNEDYPSKNQDSDNP
jgi:hypothetical protein